ncbi:MAG: lgrC [bacterium]|nr:MAG: lgrC [bacterium]
MLEKKLAHCDKQDLPLQINNTATNYPKDKTIVELFEEVVSRTPEVIAIEFESQQLTYKELNEKANQLANYLRKQGIKEETLVGVCIERSLEMVIAVLAIIKAGAGYLPLEAAYPEKRLEYLIRDARAEVILTQKRLRDKIEAISNTICLDEDWKEIEKESTSNFSVLVRPENMAYVIYTSGSTGNPKGVVVCHQSIVRLIKETNYIKIQPQDVFLQFTPISFDVSTFEIWGSLLNGAKLIVFPAYKPSLGELGKKIKEYNITVLWLISAIFHQMVEEQIDCFRGLKYLFSGGDVLGVKQVKKLLEQVPGITLINGYGPTENTTFTSCYVMTDVSQVGRTVSIGCPVSNTEIYIVDEDFNIVPIGVMGELYTSGDGLARGYLAKADLTAERFLPNPFSSKPGARLYKVGDLASYLPDGNIEFFGRKDNQVKVRGYRIELGEIETVLDTHPVVKQSVVLVGETPLGDKQLIAYLGVKENVVFIVNEIKEFLGKQLPEHMVPSRFIKIDEFPLTANEKVDRKALLALSQELSEARDYDPPATEEEKILANIWETVLAIRNVNRSDNFFELGGHSLLATRVVSRIREHFQVELSLSTFFSSETLAQLAKQLNISKSLSVVEKITPISRHQPLPLSFSQKRVWFIQQLASDHLAYTFHSKLELTGNLNLNILEKCFNEIINRHEIFRTTFSIVDEEPVQIIHPHHFNSVPIIDLSEIPEAEKTLKLEKLINDQISKEFDISELYLIRWLIIRLSHREHALIHSEHHIVHDGWSFNVFLKELVTLYQAYYLGQNPKLEELKIQFVDFAAWQHQWLETQAAKAQSAYWKNNLTGCPPLLTLPYDRVRPSLQTFQGSSFRQHLSEELCQSLRNLSREKEITLFMVMSAAFTILLYRYSGQKDIALGSTIANRRLQEVENIIGMFVNNIVLRSILSEEERFDSLLEKIKHTTLAAYENQDIPFDRVVDAVNPERSLSYSPICQVFFSFHDAQIPKLEFPEVEINLTEALSNGSSKFDLTAIVIPHFEQSIGANSSSNVKQISLVWEYNSDLFDQSTILRMSKHYQILLEKILVDGKTPVSQISFLDKSEYEQIIGFNSWQKNYYVEKFLPELFQEQALQTPNNIAVTLDGKSLTYQELNERTNQLANYLKVKIERQAVVGIYMQSCLEIVVAMIASLKSGIVYLPLSLYYPIDRLKFIINDLNLQLLITHSELKEQVSELKVAKLYLDKEDSIFNTSAKHNPKINISGQEIAYIIHTSGSTGLPKGVMITQEAITNHMVWMKDRFSITAEDTTLQRTPISFDASVCEFYLPLIVGAKLVITKPNFNADIKYLLETISSNNITTVQFVPSLLSLIIEEKEFASNKLKRVFCGGEVLSPQLRELFFKSSKAELYNVYGPTETTIDATYYQCVSEAKKQLVPIGKPIANTKAYILDKNYKIVPIGVIGELYIGGIALARGYYNRPDFTAERFISNPFSNKLGERLYSTGDQARYLADGNIEFLGRIDNQVKVKGFRIELGEIETVLNSYNAIKQAVVVVKEDATGSKYLVAYSIVSDINNPPSEMEIVTFLTSKLPSYMLPNVFVFLEEFPKNSNEKIDRDALTQLVDIKNVSEVFVEPQGDIEKMISSIWAEILNLPKVGRLDSFFHLGGHSLSATKIISRLRNQSGVNVMLRHIFENPTVAQLALVVEEESKKIVKEVKASIGDKVQNVDSNKEMLNKVNELSDKEVEQWLKLLTYD